MNGSLQKKGKYYYIVISKKDSNGKWRNKWISTKCEKKSDAKKILNKVLLEMEENTYVDPSNILFADFIVDWLNNIIKNRVETTTWDGYTTNIKTHIAPYFRQKGIKLQELRPIDLQNYFSQKVTMGRADGKGGLSGNYLKKHYANIKKALDHAVDMELIARNPIEKVDPPKVEDYEPNYYRIERLKILLEKVKGTTIEAPVVLCTYYGLRRGEVLGLRWSDIDFKEKEISICNTRTRVCTNVEKKTKTKYSQRKLPLFPLVEDYLNALKKKQSEDKLLFGDSYYNSDYICRYRNGMPINITTLNHAFKRILEDNNLPHIRFHDLRHSTASYLIKEGVSLKEIQVWLGHADFSTTANIYGHIDIETIKNTANIIDKVFTENKG